MTTRFEFQAGRWPTLFATAGIALTLALGNWQLGRGDEKAALKARFDQRVREPAINVAARELAASDVDLQRVEASGTFEPKFMVLLDNRTRQGVPGYHVLMPLKLEGGQRYVLVNRGWIAGTLDRARLPEVKTPRNVVTVIGLAVVPGRHFLELSNSVVDGNVWQNFTLERYRQAVPITIQPFVIQQDSALDDGLVREWAPAEFGADKHYGYAFQWFALSALILIFYLVTHVQRKRKG